MKKHAKANIGVGMEPPKSTCDGSNCPWHGSMPVRGRVFEGVVKSAKAKNTAVVEWGHHFYIAKFERSERRKSSVSAHNPECVRAKEGDKVTIAECRPLSKTKSFVVVGLAK